MKRIYVRPAHRGQGLGEKLMHTLMERARSWDHRQLILDAVPPTSVAQDIYRAIGFQDTAPYYPYPVQGTKFFTRSLRSVQHLPEA